MTDENKPLNYRTLSELYAAYNSGVAFEVTDSEGTYPETYPVTGMSLTEDAAGIYVFAKTSTFPHVPWSVFLPDGSLEDHSFLHLRHSPEPTQPVTEPAQKDTNENPPLNYRTLTPGALRKISTIAVSALKTNSRDIADWREDMDRIAAIAVQQGGAT